MKSNKKYYILLNVLLMVYSMSGICSKTAAGEPLLSIKFCLLYGVIIMLLGIYAIGWQQVIKKIPLTNAYANKAVTIVWGIIWGVIFFSEKVTSGKIIGALLVIIGVTIFSFSEESGEQADEQ